MKSKFKKIIMILAAVILTIGLISIPVTSRADFGDFGGSSDYGGSSDWGSSDWGSSSDYGDSYYYYGGGSDSDDDGFPIWIVVVAVIIILGIISSIQKSRKKNIPAGATATNVATLNPMSTYNEVDPEFNEADFTEHLSNLYVQMQNGWTAKDISDLRQYFTDAYFAQMDRQLDSYRTGHRTNYVERIAVLGVDLMGWKQQGGYDHIIVQMRTRIVDYTKDDKTDKIISGADNKEKFMVYEWDLCRTTGMKTTKDGGITRTTCPSCGAPVDVNVSAECPYCGNIIKAHDFDWAIANIKGISQTTR